MVVKKYTANTVNEALTRVKYELGSEAIIISRRKVRRSGFKGLFLPRIVEITAAVENNLKLPNSEESKVKAVKTNESYFAAEVMKEITQMKRELKNISNQKHPLEELLRENDLEEDLISEILTKLERGAKNEGHSKEALKAVIGEYIEVSQEELKGRIVLVGPTGVGKTTTIAKLAGRLALIEKKKVGLITIDTYRIGAVEQLRTYAEIMNISFKVVLSLKDMDTALAAMEHCDVILIDTTGRSSKNKIQVNELRAFIQKTNSTNINLVISSATKNKDIKSIIEGYGPLDFSKVIITKLDETTCYGAVLTILKHCRVPISFITTGQKVPEDIKVPSREEVISLVLGEDAIC